MLKSDYKIHIIGAGVSGLVAAQVLERRGYHPIVLEATDRVGGRVKTDFRAGHYLDHGFQVLLTAYPMAEKYLNYQALDLQAFKPGALLFREGKSQKIGDPLRDSSFLIPSIFNNAAKWNDKILIFKLNRELRKTTLEAIFEAPEQTTMAYLKAYGFSEKVISNFFVPFFGGIFLESDLITSSRMFCFVFKMFAEGLAAIPKSGIQAIPEQLKSSLKHTSFHFNTPVEKVEEAKITLSNGEVLKSHLTIVATDASVLIPNLRNQDISWNSCDNLYFEVENRVIADPLIGLISDPDSLINNITYVPHLPIEKATPLLSVTVVEDHQLNEEELVSKVKEELEIHCGIHAGNFVKRFRIKRALPKLKNLSYSLTPSESKINSTVFLAGDVLLNASLNAAMISGEQAALGVIKLLEESPDLDHLISEYL